MSPTTSKKAEGTKQGENEGTKQKMAGTKQGESEGTEKKMAGKKERAMTPGRE